MRRPVGVKLILHWLRETTFVLPPSGRCRHASIRTLEERFGSLGACWAFSVQPVLASVWRPVVLLLPSGTWARRLTQSPELGFGLNLFSSWNVFDFVLRFVLRGCCHCRSAAVVQRVVHFAAHPQVMQQHASFLAVPTMARFFPFLPPRSASFRPQRLRSQSIPKGPRMCCAPCTSSVRK
jgi:hypothetical protein